MAHVDRSVFTDDDYQVIARFTERVRELRLDLDSEAHANVRLSELPAKEASEVLQHHLFSVLNTKPAYMYQFALSFTFILDLVCEQHSLSTEDTPSPELLGKLHDQFWNFQADVITTFHELIART